MTGTGAVMPTDSPYKTILSLDGGGIRGYSSLMILEKLMGEVQNKLGLPSPPLPCECFDLIGETSTGGIIAILLGRLRMSASEALGAYSRVAELAFTPKSIRLSPTSPKYSDEKLVEAIRKELSLAKASKGKKEMLFADVEGPKTVVLAITKVNVRAEPTLFRTYSVELAWKDCKIWEIVRATSAATTFFESIKTGRDQIAFIDAGFGYNNPCEVLIAEADKAIPGRPTSCIVSIGTGLGKAVGVKAKPFTLLRALVHMATSSHAVDSRLQESFGAERPQKYWRFDEDVAISEIKMDDWKKLQAIAGHTHNYLNAYATTKAISHCADSLITAKPNLQTGTSTASGAPPLDFVRLTEDEESARQDFLRLLSFGEMDFREHDVGIAYNATYEWILSSPQYLAWKKTTGGRLLIKGKAGCGKSTLMKHLFENETSAAAADAAAGSRKTRPIICSFYFNGRGGPMEKTLKGMLRTILHQIVFQNPITYRCLSQFHEDMKNMKASREHTVDWTGESLTKMFDILMRSSTLPQLIFIDALDEGEGFLPADVFSLLEKYTYLQPDGRHAAACICISSRPDNFVNQRKDWITVDLADYNSDDIKTYTMDRLDTMAKACADSHYESLAVELVPEILHKADGVFLWVKLVMDRIVKAMGRGEMKEYIKSLISAAPTDLWDHFESILIDVEDHHRPGMRRLLQVVLAVERPLSVEELAHVLPLSSPDPPGTLHDVWDVKTAEQTRKDMKRRILLYCGGLVEVVETWRSFYITGYMDTRYQPTTQVQFMHQSVKDYLNSKRIPNELAGILGSPRLEQKGHQLILTACLQYLQLPEMFKVATRTGPNPRNSTQKELRTFWDTISNECPFLLYSPFWVKHADKAVEADSELAYREGLQTMQTMFQTWRFFPYSSSDDSLYERVYNNISVDSDETSNLLVFSAYQGFIRLFRQLFTAYREDIPQLHLDQALIATCNSESKGQKFSYYGSSREIRDRESEERGFGLPDSVWQAKEVIVDILLNGGADVNQHIRRGRFGSALTAASWSGRLSIVHKLLDHGANVNAEIKGMYYATALVASVWGSSTEVTKALLDRGAKVNFQVGLLGSALTEAAYSGNPSMVQTLLEGGADANLRPQRGQFGSALAAATHGKGSLQAQEQIMEMLIGAGAEVDLLLESGGYGSALAAAVSSGGALGENLAAVKLLLQHGANPNLRLTAGEYGSALTAAIDTGNLDLVKHLVTCGADANAILSVGKYGSALAAAATGIYSSDVVEYLVTCGADVNAVLSVGEYGSALAAAATSVDNSDVVEHLVARGANVNAVLSAGKYGSALAAAASNDHGFDITKQLVAHGANVNAVLRVGEYGSALAAAAAARNTEIVKHLVACGADINAVLYGGKYGSALAAAASSWAWSYSRTKSLVLFLLEHGTNINAVLPVGTYGSALAAALEDGYPKIKRLLFERGAKLSGNEKSPEYVPVWKPPRYGPQTEESDSELEDCASEEEASEEEASEYEAGEYECLDSEDEVRETEEGDWGNNEVEERPPITRMNAWIARMRPGKPKKTIEAAMR